MTEISWEWLAGFFDGEGSITTSGTSTGAQRVYLIVANTYEPVIRRIHGATGVGQVYVPKSPNAKYKQAYRWCVTRAIDVCMVLEEISPYMLVKAEQARIALDIVRAPKERYFLTDQERSSREGLFNQLHVLNRKGSHRE